MNFKLIIRTDITSKQIKNEITFKGNGKSFFEVAAIHMKELITNNKFSRLSVHKAYLDHLLNFAQSRRLSFQDIDEIFLKGYKAHLINIKSLSERFAVNHPVLIRTLYTRAILEGIVDQKFYPFGMGKIKIKFPESRKLGLTTEEIKAIEQLENLAKEEQHARNVWLFSFYLAGIRIGDVLKIRWCDIYDARLRYTMNKNSKLVSLRLPEKIRPILKNYAASKLGEGDFLFPELKKAGAKNPKDIFSKIKTANKRLNRQLSKVAVKAKI